MFWICAENSVDNEEMFLLFLSSSYTVSRLFLLLTPPHQQVGWECRRSWEGTRLGQLTPSDQRDSPYHMMSCSADKAGGRRRKRGNILSYGVLPSQVTVMHDGALLSWRWLNTCLPMGRSEWNPWFSFLTCTVFALLTETSLSQPRSFLTFTFLILFRFPPGGSERAAVWCLVAGWG